MNHNNLPVFPRGRFADSTLRQEDAEFCIFGNPFDGRTTGRKTSLRATDVFRYFSSELETTSFRFRTDYRKLRICDLGDILGMKFDQVFEDTKRVFETVASQGSTPGMLGGEHTFTWAAIDALKPDSLIVFDAHLDMRDAYLGQSSSHTTFLRRITEQNQNLQITHIGLRAAEVEELTMARKADVKLYDCSRIMRDPSILLDVRNDTKDKERVYVSVDLDVLDPAYMNTVSNPEPSGLSPDQLFSLFGVLEGQKIVGFDVVELSPTAQWSPSYHLAAKTVFELMCAVSKEPDAKIDDEVFYWETDS